MRDPLIRASHGPRELITGAQNLSLSIPLRPDPIAHLVYRNTNRRRRYHTSQNESVPTSREEEPPLQIPALPNLGLSFIHRLTAAAKRSFYEQRAKKSMAYKAETHHLN